MEILIVVAIMTIVVKRGVEDVIHTAKGGTPPRYAAASARRKSGAAGRYWGQLWDDVWDDASKRHTERRERASSPSRPRGAFRVFLSNLWRDGWVRAERRRQEKATRPRPGQQTVPGTVVPNAQDEDRPQDGDGPVPTSVPDEDDRTVPQDEHPDPTEDGDGDEQDEPNPGPESVPDSGPDSGPDSLIPPEWLLGPAPTTTQEGPTTMSTATGEVTGLDTAIRFCEDSARGYQAQIHEIELAKASLTAAEATAVAGPLASAMEMTEAAAKAMKEAEAELRKQVPIAELYRANPGAATKDFMLQG